MPRLVADRFWAKVAVAGPDDCWLWLGGTAPNGYGKMRGEGSVVTIVHRIAYEVQVGPIPEGLTIDHVWARGCTSRLCVNARHLEPVPLAVNMARGGSPAAVNARKTHCPRGHAYTVENTYRRKGGARICKTCHNSRRRVAQPTDEE